MKLNLMFLALLLLVMSLGVGQARKVQQNSTSCGFAMQGESVEPTIKGPDELVPLVYVVEQPDSPIEVVSVDLTGMWLSISHERTTEHFCTKYHVRNRSDRTVQKFEIMLELSTIGGAEARGRSARQRCLPDRPLTLSLVALEAMEAPRTITCVCLFMWTKLILKIATTNHPSDFRAASECIQSGSDCLCSRG